MKKANIVIGKQIVKAFKEDTWEHTAFVEITRTIQDITFPCYFARIAELRESAYYAFTDSAIEPGSLEGVVDYLTEFTNVVKTSHARKRFALLLVFKPEDFPRDNGYYAEIFWRLLNHLHEHDPQLWPERVPTDPNDGDFEFCFNGIALFTFANTPVYIQRHSRNLGKSLVIVFVPATSFFGVKLLTPGGIAARRQIRQRLEKYDGTEHFPDFGKVDEGIPLAWKSYFIPDENTTIITECPFKFKGGGDMLSQHDDQNSV